MNISARPKLLIKKAEAKRLETGDSRYYAALERQDATIMKRVEHVLATPFIILFHEPMLVAITLYQSVCLISPRQI